MARLLPDSMTPDMEAAWMAGETPQASYDAMCRAASVPVQVKIDSRGFGDGTAIIAITFDDDGGGQVPLTLGPETVMCIAAQLNFAITARLAAIQSAMLQMAQGATKN